jgi:sugar phosphate isomerase/epimerase
MRSALSELTPLAAETNVTLAVEPMHAGCAADWTFLTSLDESLALLDELGSEHVKLAFDTYHLAHEDAIIERLPELVPKIAIVQLGDSRQEPHGDQNRCRLGDGRIPLRRIVEVLVDAGYGGFFDVELMGEEIEASDYRELLTQSRQTFDDWVGARN